MHPAVHGLSCTVLNLFLILQYFQNSDRETDEEEEEAAVTPIMVEDALEQIVDEEILLEMPKHRRCGAHTVNLIATADVSKVIICSFILAVFPYLL